MRRFWIFWFHLGVCDLACVPRLFARRPLGVRPGKRSGDPVLDGVITVGGVQGVRQGLGLEVVVSAPLAIEYFEAGEQVVKCPDVLAI